MGYYTLRKHERLKSHKVIQRLNDRSQNHSVFEHPFILAWVPMEQKSPVPAKVLISVSRRRFKKAVQRNRIKRRVRELYRIRKPELYEFLRATGEEPLGLMIVYIGKEEFSYKTLEEKFNRLIEKFCSNIKEGS